MISLREFIRQQLNEGKVDGLNNVTVIRHYTTFAALKSILSKGYIEPRESKGDSDWDAYDIGEKKVVSFHDSRTDPEWKNALEYNKDKLSFDGRTHTLGTNAKKICACIEIDFDKLDKLIQDKAHLLNIYGQKADEFVNFWNEHVKWLTENKLPTTKQLKLTTEGVNRLVKLINDGDEEILKAVKSLLKFGYSREEKLISENGNLLVENLIDIFEKYYSDKELEAKTKTSGCYDTMPLKYGLVYLVLNKFLKTFRTKPWSDEFDESSLHEIELSEADKLMIEILNQDNYREYTEDERQELIDAVKRFDLLKVVKMVWKHGWRKGDDDRYSKANYHINYKGRHKYGDKYEDATLLFWIDRIMSNRNRITNGDIEIRIPAEVEINKENCKIIIFDGIAEAIKQNPKLPQKYYKEYNIEHIKSEKD
ncbi:MAG: hypothetical protein J1F35_08595 [Erysipelotrichales bacterium]|nr:hypothetical protein [Erysipelotrichales bacterium]